MLLNLVAKDYHLYIIYSCTFTKSSGLFEAYMYTVSSYCGGRYLESEMIWLIDDIPVSLTVIPQL